MLNYVCSHEQEVMNCGNDYDNKTIELREDIIMKLKKIVALLMLMTMTFALAACGSDEPAAADTSKDTQADTSADSSADSSTDEDTNTDADTQPEENADEAILTGQVTVSGSTSVEKIGQASGEEFMALNPGVEFTYEGIGSSGGIQNANDRVTNIGTASRGLKESEEEYGLTVKTIAYDGIAVVVHPSNGVEDLSMEQIHGIYTGQITNWSEVGGKDATISVVSREDGSGTRGAFEELVGFEDELKADAVIKDGNGNVQATVASNEDAIGYVSFTYLDDSIKGIKVEGVDPTVENVLNESFKLSRPFLMVYHEDNMNEAAHAYVDFIMSDEGQAIVEQEGGISVN